MKPLRFLPTVLAALASLAANAADLRLGIIGTDTSHAPAFARIFNDTAAKEHMFDQTDKAKAPWLVVKSNDKKRGRINAMRAFLNQFDYEDKNTDVIHAPDPLIVARAKHTEGD